MIAPRLFPVFSALFGLLYVLCMFFNWPAFTYYPELGEFVLDWQSMGVEAGPPMFYFGWLTNALGGAIVLTLLAALVPDSLAKKAWPGWVWVVCLAAMVFAVYDMRAWFITGA